MRLSDANTGQLVRLPERYHDLSSCRGFGTVLAVNYFSVCIAWANGDIRLHSEAGTLTYLEIVDD